MSHETRKTLADRLRARAAHRRRQAEAASQQSSDAVRHIPLGQPILVGHYSEKRHRRDLARSLAAMEKAAKLYKESRELAERAIGSENNNAIFSDDPDAIPQLEAKLADLIQQRDRNTAINKLVRKKDRAGLLEMGLKEATVDALFTPDCFGRLGIPVYVNSNLSGNIKRVKQRIQELTAKRANESQEFKFGDIIITENVEADRLQITFPGKPDAATVKTLKSHGFRWAPSVGAWQRNLNNGARYACQRVLGLGEYPPTQA